MISLSQHGCRREREENERIIFVRCFLKSWSPLHAEQSSRCHGAPQQQQGEAVRVQQQGTGQPSQGVQGQQTEGFLTQVQTGIKIPDQGVRKGKKVSYQRRTDAVSAKCPVPLGHTGKF